MDKKYVKLFLSILLDVIGYLTFIPFDFAWAPIAGFIMTRMYKGSKGKIAGLISFLEEIIPFTDVVPTFTLMWLYTYIISNKREKKISERISK